MATVFDLILVHDDKEYARQAAWEAIKEIERLENELSRFKPNSDISRINNLKVGERIVLSSDTFNCISRSFELHSKTKGAFNIACAPLLKCWLNQDYSLKNPTDDEIENAKKLSKIENIVLHKKDFSIEITEEGAAIDLGAFGKGYAVDVIAEVIFEWNIKSALLSSGRSSIKAIGNPDGKSGWLVSISNPANKNVIKIFSISDISLGASGITKGSHIINSITGLPEIKKTGSWVFSQDTADADAFSTAFMIMDNKEIGELATENISAIVINSDINGTTIVNEFGLLPLLAD